MNNIFQDKFSRLGSIKEGIMLPKRRMVVMVLLSCVISLVHYQWPEPIELSQSYAEDIPQRWSVISIDYDFEKQQQETSFEEYSKEVNDLVEEEENQYGMRDRDPDMTTNFGPWPKSAMTIRDYQWRNSTELPRPISREMHDEFIELLKALMGLLDGASVSYVMGSGSMIGVYAFHDMIPWDDDVDIWVDYRDLPKVKRMLRNPSLRQSYGAQAYWNEAFCREYDLTTLLEFPENVPDEEFYRWSYHGEIHYDDVEEEHHLFKFYRNDGLSFGHFPWRYPFIDVSYFGQNETHVWNHKPIQSRIISVPKDLFYPIVYRPLAWLKVPTVYNVRRIIQIKYGHLKCKQHKWNHVDETERIKEKKMSAKCPNLLPYYPIVWPGEWRDGFQEELLVLDDTAIQSVRVRAPISNEIVGLPRTFWDFWKSPATHPRHRRMAVLCFALLCYGSSRFIHIL